MSDRAQEIANELLNNPEAREEYDAWWYKEDFFFFTRFEGVLWDRTDTHFIIACTDGKVRKVLI